MTSMEAVPKQPLAELEEIALNELLDTFPSEMDDAQHSNGDSQKRRKVVPETKIPILQSMSSHQERIDRFADSISHKSDGKDTEIETIKAKDPPRDQPGLIPSGRHTKFAELEQHVRNLERENLHLKQALLLGTKDPHEPCPDASAARLLAERTKVVTEMVERLNAPYLSLGDAARVWHEHCRIGVGVREWDAVGRLQTISLWNLIRSVFSSIVIDIVELRPHLPDGAMILTKWRIQGEIASTDLLARVCASEDCPATMRIALLAIQSADLTFTVTAYVVFQDLHIVEQHHSWDQVGVFKRLFGGDIPSSVQKMLVIDEATAAGRKQPLDV